MKPKDQRIGAYIYVVRFMEGPLKVGFSTNPDKRTTDHLPVNKIVDKKFFQCVGDAAVAESHLKLRLAEVIRPSYGHEWFNVDFDLACRLAQDCANDPNLDPAGGFYCRLALKPDITNKAPEWSTRLRKRGFTASP